MLCCAALRLQTRIRRSTVCYFPACVPWCRFTLDLLTRVGLRCALFPLTDCCRRRLYACWGMQLRELLIVQANYRNISPENLSSAALCSDVCAVSKLFSASKTLLYAPFIDLARHWLLLAVSIFTSSRYIVHRLALLNET